MVEVIGTGDRIMLKDARDQIDCGKVRHLDPVVDEVVKILE